MIIWIASYPKSGNTWVRAILCSLLYSNNGNLRLSELEKINQFPMKNHFTDLTDDMFNIEEIAKNWLPAQKKINLDNSIKFFKTHNAFCRYGNFVFTDKKNTLATIYIVRDPRNIISSLAYHYSLDIDSAKKMLFSSKRVLGNETSYKSKGHVYTVLGNWANHDNSWKKLDPENTLFLKYEDLIIDSKLQILKIANFLKKYLKVNFTDSVIENTLLSTEFNNLKFLEKRNGFYESVTNKITNKKMDFFNLGKENDWKRLLDDKTRLEIEEKFSKELGELGYLN